MATKRKKKTNIKGSQGRLRLSVFRSNVHTFAQLIDDVAAVTLVEASSLKLAKKSKVELAREVGKLLAERAVEKQIKHVVFDRGSYRYVGRIKALAESARENGLIF